MQKYSDLINRITEIILLSEKRKEEIGIQDSESYNDNFVKMLWFDIDLSLANEFQELLDMERTWHILVNSENPTEKNSKLLQLCKERASIANNETEDYFQLMEFINNSNQRYVTELAEYKGYFVLKEDLTMFIALCRKLKVGPYTLIKTLPAEEAKKEVNSELEKQKDQRKRLNNYLNEPVAEVENDVIVDNPNDTKEEIEEDISTSNDNKNKKRLSSDYGELIYLGIIGKLTPDMVIELKNAMEDEEYIKLLNELRKWQIFSQRQLDRIKKLAFSKVKEVRNIDELIGFLALRENLNPEALKLLIPSIGYHNYHYMMDQLFKFGAIDFDYYMDSVREMIGEEKKGRAN